MARAGVVADEGGQHLDNVASAGYPRGEDSRPIARLKISTFTILRRPCLPEMGE